MLPFFFVASRSSRSYILASRASRLDPNIARRYE